MVSRMVEDGSMTSWKKWNSIRLLILLKFLEYGYLRPDFVCIAGAVAYRAENMLIIEGKRIIGFEKDDEEHNRLNVLLRDTTGNIISQFRLCENSDTEQT